MKKALFSKAIKLFQKVFKIKPAYKAKKVKTKLNLARKKKN